MSIGIRASGLIEYSTDTPVLKHFTGTRYFRNMSAETIARLFDMCPARPMDEEKIRQVKQTRPDFQALLYRNIRAIYITREDEWQTAVENNWLLTDENGEYVYVLTWPNNYVVDIGNPEYQFWVANWIKEHIDQYGYDGVYADYGFNARADGQWFDLSATPINPRTGVHWTNAEVRQALIQLCKKLRNALGSKLIVCNGIFEGKRFECHFDEYVEVLSNCSIDGINSEGIWYQYKGTWPSEERWLQCLNMLVWFQDNFLKGNPRSAFVSMCKMERMDGGQYPFPPGCTPRQIATYAFASTLLGIKTNQNYLCLNANVNITTEVVQPLYNIVVGTPANDYYMIEGTHVYTRDFSKVKVLVNPTSNPYTVNLEESYRTLDGQIVTEIMMVAHTGRILMKAP